MIKDTTDNNKNSGRPSDRQEETFRYERKFVLDAGSLFDFRHQLKLHPAMFRQAYAPRDVNNLYFDNREFDSLFDNLEGATSRTKIRVRWYGDLLGRIDSPFLEFKIKQGAVGTKRRYDLPPFQLDAGKLDEAVKALFSASTIRLPDAVSLQLANVTPALLNCYRREYYESHRGFRITIDSNLKSYQPNQTTFLSQPHGEIVVELKYDRDLDPAARTLLSHFGLRVMKNSKYVNGLSF